MSLNYTGAFAKYGATLTNKKWSVSAFGSNGCLVVSLYQKWIKAGEVKGTLVYRDTLSQWPGNDPGRNEFRRHLREVKSSNTPIRLVIVHTDSAGDAALMAEVSDESKIEKTYSAPEHFVGSLEEFDDDNLCIVFRRAG